MKRLLLLVACGCSQGPSLITTQLRVANGQHPLALADRVTFSLTDAMDRTLAVRQAPPSQAEVTLDPVPAGSGYRLMLEGTFGGDALARAVSCRFQVPSPPVPLYLGELGKFALTGEPSVVRSGAVGFADGGRALLVGGDAGGGPLPTSEAYSPGSALFAPAETLAAARFNAVSARQGDSTLVIGGAAAAPAVEAFRAGAWSPVLTLIPPSLTETAAATLGDGTVLVCGGRAQPGGAPLDRAWLIGAGALDPQSPLNVARAGHSLTPAGDERGAAVFVIGGAAEIEIFDPVTVSFAQLGVELLQVRHAHTATRLSSGRILVAGGLDDAGMPLAWAELLDPVARRMVPAAAMATSRSGHSATLLASGRVLIAGGSDASGPTSAVEIFDPELGPSGAFIAAQPLQAPRSGHVVIPLCDGTLLFAGGGAGAERYVPVP
jgi:hypothetical protein